MPFLRPAIERFTRIEALLVLLFVVSVPRAHGAACTDTVRCQAALPALSPGPRWDAAAVWDPVQSRMWMVGGYDGWDSKREVWTYTPSLNAWQHVLTAGTPPPCVDRHTAVLDPARRRLIIYGGSLAPIDSIWSLSLDGTPTWSAIRTTGGPPPKRTDHVAVLDAGRDRLVVYGGKSSTLAVLNDCWALSLSTYQWTALASSSFGFGEAAAGIYDPLQQRLIVFGGRNYAPAACPASSRTNTAHVIALPLATSGSWSQITAPGGPAPAAEAHAFYDPQCSRLVVWGGVADRDCQSSCSAPAETGQPAMYGLRLSGAPAWDVLPLANAPSGRGHAALVYDPSSARAFLHGGGFYETTAGGAPPCTTSATSFTYLDDTWSFTFPDVTPPAVVTNLAVQLGRTTAVVSWTAPGNNGAQGTAAEYDLRYSFTGISEATFASAPRAVTTAPHAAGSSEFAQLMNLTQCSRYYFALKTRDAAGNWSAISNVTDGRTCCPAPRKYCEEILYAVGPAGGLPDHIELALGGSNPAMRASRVTYTVPAALEGQPCNLSVFNVVGQRVRTLESTTASPGRHAVEWDLRSDDGRELASGMYLVRLRVGSFEQTSRSLVLR